MAENFPHIVLSQTGRSVKYTSTGGGGGAKFNSPPRPARIAHGESILNGLAKAQEQAERDLATQPIGAGLQFIPMEFEQHQDFPMMLEQLDGERLGVRIVNARTVGDRTRFTVAMPKSSVTKFAEKIKAYMTRDTAKGKPMNENLAIGIASVNPVHLSEYWTGSSSSLPDRTERFWWEVWLQTETDPANEVEAWFRRTSGALKLTVSNRAMVFPERLVVLAFVTLDEWLQFPGLLQFLAEFRRANLIAGEFTRLTPNFQGELVRDLRSRLAPAAQNAASVCILDTGVNRGHPLLEASLSTENSHSWDADWQTSDHDGHGTAMAGLALLGPLGEHLLKPGKITLTHLLESVKILPPKGRNDPPDYAPITLGAMALAEITASDRNRVFSMAVTASGHDNWQPTLWSAGLDQATSGQRDGKQRLIVVSAGNLEEKKIDGYPNENHVSSIEDPAQSWNAITVGAFTDLVWDENEGTQGYVALAPRGGLSPASRTSLTWSDSHWPFKPDIVFEGGNRLKSANGFVMKSEDLELLTVQLSDDSDALLGTTADTSAATAGAARMAAILQSEYPGFWPETIRALMIHSAEWTPQMIREFPQNRRKERLRVYGMGVPNLDRARRSVENFATMVIQDQIQPYYLDGKDAKTNEMHLHELPLPVRVLQDMGSIPIQMRVTLSYFIEPNPPRRGYVAQFRYPSHGLRFSLIRPGENTDRFLTRLTSSVWPEENQSNRKPPENTVKDDRNWVLGEKTAVRGSIHSDAWNGTAAELAQSSRLAIYPVTGWWRERSRLGFVNKQARYSLVISISTPDESIKLYSLVSSQIQAMATIPISVVVD